jgi:hypothetical protein
VSEDVADLTEANPSGPDLTAAATDAVPEDEDKPKA